MVFDATTGEIKTLAIKERQAAKDFLANVLETASKESTVLVTDVVNDTAALARSYIPASASMALMVFDKLSAGLEVQVEGELNTSVQVAFSHAVDALSALLPGQANQASTVPPSSPTAQATQTDSATKANQATPDPTRAGLDTVAGVGKIGAQGSVNYDTPGVHLPPQAQDAIPSTTDVLDHATHDPRAGNTAPQSVTIDHYGEEHVKDVVTPEMTATVPTTVATGEHDESTEKNEDGQPGVPGHPGDPTQDIPHGLI